MYEYEVGFKNLPETEVPSDLKAFFLENTPFIEGKSALPWGEHCTECVWPSCYKSCEFYDPRPDQKCRRFDQGYFSFKYPKSVNGYILRITFKKWAKLLAKSNLKVFPLKYARLLESASQNTSLIVSNLRSFKKIRAVLIRLIAKLRNKVNSQFVQRNKKFKNTFFICEIYQDQVPDIGLFSNSLTLVIKSSGSNDQVLIYEKKLDLKKGYNLFAITHSELSKIVDNKNCITFELTPNFGTDSPLYFGVIDFVEFKIPKYISEKQIKCIVWDLDNTIWQGVLLEDDPDSLVVKPYITNLLSELNNHGIVCSIASKNNQKDAVNLLKKFNLDDYFVFPQISLNPKSMMIDEIAGKLNISKSSLLFVDDQTFEIEEVLSSDASIQTMNAKYYLSLFSLPQLKTNPTDESKKRKQYYAENELRSDDLKRNSGDYLNYLKTCKIKIFLSELNLQNINRIHELTQRTNQLNFSGQRFTFEKLSTLINNPCFETFVILCEDRFGSYGITGFSLIEKKLNKVTDLMFSCRLQGKKIEHAFLEYLIQRTVKKNMQNLSVKYKQTDKNVFLRKVFDELEFIPNEKGDLFTYSGSYKAIFSQIVQLTDGNMNSAREL